MNVPAHLSPAPPGSFTVAAIPDTQDYSASQPELFFKLTEWIAGHVESQRTAFVTHVGDLVDNNTPEEWAVAVRAMRRLDGVVPYGMAPGNGDMDCKTGDVSRYLAHFPARHYEEHAWHGGSHPQRGNAASFQVIEAGGIPLLFLHLEVNAPDSVLSWANEVLAGYPGRVAMVTTHAFLGPIEKPTSKEGYFDDPKGVMRWARCHGGKGNPPQAIWDKCLRKHPNVRLILCGDQSRTQTMRLTLPGAGGHPVHACLSDYRGGNLRLYRFLRGDRRIEAYTWTVPEGRMCEGTRIAPDPGQHQFTLEWNLDL
jgi:hypothetical protein